MRQSDVDRARSGMLAWLLSYLATRVGQSKAVRPLIRHPKPSTDDHAEWSAQV